MKDDWQLLTYSSLEEISQARMQCHQAIQNVAAVGRSLSPSSPRDEYGSLSWDADLQRLVGSWVTADVTFRSSISIKDFEVFLVDEQVQTISSFAMAGKTQTEVMVWLEHELSKLGADFSKINLSFPYEIPEYPTAKREVFEVNNLKAYQKLSSLYHNTALLLSKLPVEDPISTTRCWPHHFDMVMTITRLNTGDPETSRSITLGMSPGDQYYDEPYFFVTSRPYPMDNLLPISDIGGHWHQDDWVGAVLTYSSLQQETLIQDQRRLVAQFYEKVLTFLKEII